jgi:hypothetical protein
MEEHTHRWADSPINSKPASISPTQTSLSLRLYFYGDFTVLSGHCHHYLQSVSYFYFGCFYARALNHHFVVHWMASQHGKKKFRGRGGCRNLYCCKGGWRTSRYYIIILFDICARTQTCVYIVLFYLTGQELVVRFSVVVGLFFFMFWWVWGGFIFVNSLSSLLCYVVSSICKFRLAVCS